MFQESVKDANQQVRRFVIKRSGRQVPFEPIKIRRAVEAANADEAREDKKLTRDQIDHIVETVTSVAFHTNRALSVEEIQDLVQHELFQYSYEVFLRFHDWRSLHQEKRNMTGLDEKIKGIVEVSQNENGQVVVQNEEVKQENANKNPTVLSVQRDYMAGEWSRYYTDKYLLPPDITQAHEQGIIHFHDSDYFAQHMHNCDLINLEDMLQNGTSVSGVHIDPPKSFATACTVASQIVAQVASSQYGGQTFTMSHLAPFEIGRAHV